MESENNRIISISTIDTDRSLGCLTQLGMVGASHTVVFTGGSVLEKDLSARNYLICQDDFGCGQSSQTSGFDLSCVLIAKALFTLGRALKLENELGIRVPIMIRIEQSNDHKMEGS